MVRFRSGARRADVAKQRLKSAHRQLTLTLALRLPRVNGETALVQTLEAEPGIAKMQLDPLS